MERQPNEWEKIFESHASSKGLMPEIYKELTELNSKNQEKKI